MRDGARSAIAVVVLALACTPSAHRLAPYRDDPEAAAELESVARDHCTAGREQERLSPELPPHAFTTDGCSAWPDGDWVQCCVDHDMAYWCGGTSDQRREADQRFRDCVGRDHGGALATSMYWGVRMGGSAWWPMPWRWAYGWSWPHGYDSNPPTSADPESGNGSKDLQ